LGGNVVFILNSAKDERIQYPERIIQEGIASILSVPMTLRSETIGIFNIYTSEIREFTGDDIYFAKAMANLSSIALENATVYQAIQREKQKIGQELQRYEDYLTS
jgi:GAF domain-containing protein